MMGANHPQIQPAIVLCAHMRTGRRASVLPMRLAATLGLIALALEKTARERSGDPAPTAKFHTLASVLGNPVLAIRAWGNSVLGNPVELCSRGPWR